VRCLAWRILYGSVKANWKSPAVFEVDQRHRRDCHRKKTLCSPRAIERSPHLAYVSVKQTIEHAGSRGVSVAPPIKSE
jgi:hypothetical protein